MVTISKDAVVREIAGQNGLTLSDVREVIEMLCGIIAARAEAGDTVRLPGFGSFNVRARPARAGRNPANGEPLAIPETRRLVFKASRKALG